MFLIKYRRMSSEIEGQLSLDLPVDTNQDSQKKFKISYTRDFLLSLNELDVCKKLPSGFDQSLLSEFEGVAQNLPDRPRVPGSLSLQSFRRSEYGSSPPTRGDSNNYSRAAHGRWDSRSRDSDSQSDRDSDTGKRYVSQSRRSWQNSEHDGLLGSGSSARPSGYAAGVSAPKFRANDPNQLNKTNEPYHPPRPYKAVPHSRRETNDLYNDETFGSADSTSEDRAEEERKRRASFELMRKEQHKAFEEKQNLKADKHKDDCVSQWLEDSMEEKNRLNRNKESDDSAIMPASHNDTGKPVLPSQTSAPRPLVPPGFATTILDRNSGTKSLISSHSVEVRIPEHEGLSCGQGKPLQEEKQVPRLMDLSEKQHETMSIPVPSINKIEKVVNPSSALGVSNKSIRMDNQLYKIPNVSEAREALPNDEIIKLASEKGTTQNTTTVSIQDHPTSILEKLFGSALAVNDGGSSSFTEHHDSKIEDTWSPSASQSSKFAHWFVEDEKKPVDDLSFNRPSDLLSLIVGGEKNGSQVSEGKATEQLSPKFSFQSSDFASGHMKDVVPSEQLYDGIKPEQVPSVLTCEDLEQSILSEIGESSSTLQPLVQGMGVVELKTDPPKANIDNRASQHLLSLLQKGTDLKDTTSSLNTASSEKVHGFEVPNIGGVALNTPGAANSEKVHDLGNKTLTLETLFGTSFMKELQSFEAPVSIQRGPAGSSISESHGSLVPDLDNELSPLKSSVLAPNHRQQTGLGKIEGNWLGFNDPQTELEQPNRGGFDGGVEIQLPEEDSLITVSDPPINFPTPMFMARDSNTPVGIAEKLAALNAGLKDERSLVRGQEVGPPFLRNSFDMIESEIPYHNRHAQPSSPPQFAPPHGRPLFHPLDTHPSQMKFPERIIHHHDHQFSSSMNRGPPFHHLNTGISGFDHPPSHHPMLQQMNMPGNFPPPHLLQGFPRGAPLPPHLNNHQAAGFEPDPMHGFPIGHRQPNFGGLGMPPFPGPDIGVGNRPDAIQRLIEMELRTNPKQIHPFTGHGQGMYGHELDMSFRYR